MLHYPECKFIAMRLCFRFDNEISHVLHCLQWKTGSYRSEMYNDDVTRLVFKNSCLSYLIVS